MALLGKFVSFGRGVRVAWATLSLALFAVSAAWAAEPVPWQMGFQPAASPVRDHIDFLHDVILLPIITVISLFVLGLLLYVIIRYDAKRHPTPSKTTHHTVIEVIWTAIPILILLVIFFPSMKLLYYVDRAQKADMTLKVTGRQWYWSYEYPDQNNFTFDSTMLAEDEVGKYGEKRLLGVDKPVVVPVGATVRILVGGSDVIHSWFVPSMGVQEYAVVGRENEAWMKVEKPGTYYGQCNQICGLNHPFMPIEIKAVSKDDFERWLKQPESLWNVPKKSASETPDTDAAARIAVR